MSSWRASLDLVRSCPGLEVADGLTAEEISRAEERFRIRFPPDLAELLREGLPRGGRFPDWRSLPDSIGAQLAWPLEGLLFDVEQDAFWMPEWGPRPPSLEEAGRG